MRPQDLLVLLTAVIIHINADVTVSQSKDGFCTKGDQGCQDKSKTERPNIVLLFADDMGYGDLASYGHPVQEPGALDELARKGVRFTQFYSADSLCSPSRVGLLTGRLPIRAGVVGGRRVFFDFDSGGLPKEELTVAEALRDLGYSTGFVGKWHLGINAKNSTDGAHLPSGHGFDFVGHNLPLTDMWQCDESGTLMKNGPDRSKCYVYNGHTIVQQPISHSTLTDRFLNDFRLFLKETYDNDNQKPFFFYFSFSQVHTSLETAPRFRGSSKRGPFGDSLAEMQDAVGQVVKALESREGLAEKTLIIFMSDHGPHKEACTYGGSTGGLRGGKGNSYEGGVRVPAIAYWPTVIKEGQISDAVLSSLDILPSLVKLAGGDLLDDRHFDGIEAHEALINSEEAKVKGKLQKRTLFFYCNEKLASVRRGALKFHLLTTPDITGDEFEKYCPRGVPIKDWYKAQLCFDGDLTKNDPPVVYDLNKDPFEMYPLTYESIKDEWEEVKILIDQHKKSIIKVEKQLGNYNPNVIPCCNKPKCECNYP